MVAQEANRLFERTRVDAAARSLTRGCFFPFTINDGGGKLSTDCSLGWNKLERRGALLS